MENKRRKIHEELEVVKVGYANGVAEGFPLEQADKDKMIDQAEEAYGKFLDALKCDWRKDPNSMETPRRVAKAYVNDLWAGRYTAMSPITSFPSDGYDGIVIERNIPLTSMCSHHHQTVKGTAYIGIIASDKLIGLSKYTRIAQWCASRGTLQEELANDIVREIQKATGAEHLGVYVQATHGCCENRGIMAHSSLTQTTVLKGAFKDDPGTKKEFMDNIKLQQEFAPR